MGVNYIRPKNIHGQLQNIKIHFCPSILRRLPTLMFIFI